MHIALQGLLIGAGLGLVLFLFEYFSAHKSANTRAKKMAKKAELNQDERARLRNMTSFAVFILPPLFAFIFWLMG